MSSNAQRPSPSEAIPINRRDAIRIGGAAGLASLAGAEKSRAADRPGFGRAKSCLIVFLAGGPSHVDTLDPKPEAPERVRGPFRPIATAAPGLRICEHLPGLARLANSYCIVRSLSHAEARHDEAVHLMLTGREASGTDLTEDGRGAAPHLGSALASLASGDMASPAFVTAPDHLAPIGPVRPGQDAGRLGHRFDPLVLRGNPNRDDFDPFGDVPAPSAALRRAAAVKSETPRLRERYGRDLFGQSLLLGRRLVEAGVPVVQVNAVRFLDRGWDTHDDSASTLKDDLLPSLDRALSALLGDMAESGLLDQTLVVVTGEFGRSPRMNASGGRDHWPNAFSAILAGAGLPGGRAIGATDALGAYPTDSPITPGVLASTIFHALGVDGSSAGPIDPGADAHFPDDRPALGLWDGRLA